ncbi:hypothetical protein PMZ80_004239 [Knufia obscura]|uniref:Uncharacterized protein n=2 Tax=Knufia TaxID=430999 RepID=A0AAN8EGS2_9EURO|nr:hypothetical protein PMZ80_004239 [Knufia obscura]KAK5949260.1 hypothetical protein OHC33_009801 [Knufia fluminis]
MSNTSGRSAAIQYDKQHLLGIPPELRNIIYKHYFRDAQSKFRFRSEMPHESSAGLDKQTQFPLFRIYCNLTCMFCEGCRDRRLCKSTLGNEQWLWDQENDGTLSPWLEIRRWQSQDAMYPGHPFRDDGAAAPDAVVLIKQSRHALLLSCSQCYVEGTQFYAEARNVEYYNPAMTHEWTALLRAQPQSFLANVRHLTFHDSHMVTLLRLHHGDAEDSFYTGTDFWAERARRALDPMKQAGTFGNLLTLTVDQRHNSLESSRVRRHPPTTIQQARTWGISASTEPMIARLRLARDDLFPQAKLFWKFQVQWTNTSITDGSSNGILSETGWKTYTYQIDDTEDPIVEDQSWTLKRRPLKRRQLLDGTYAPIRYLAH